MWWKLTWIIGSQVGSTDVFWPGSGNVFNNSVDVMEPLAQQEISEPVGKALKSGEKVTK